MQKHLLNSICNAKQTQVVYIIIIFYTQALDKVQLIIYKHDFFPVFVHL